MNEWIKQVTDFQLKFENPIKNYKNADELIKHRAKLIEEEFKEYITASDRLLATTDPEEQAKAVTEMLDAIADMTVINIGTANLLGMDLDEAMRRVYESNMSKLGKDGKPIYNEAGKVMKGPNYHKPKNLEELVSTDRAAEFIRKCKEAKEPKKDTTGEGKVVIIVVEKR